MDIRYQKLISWVEDIKELNHCSASALLILKDDEMVLEHYSGSHSNREGSLPITQFSQFNVASARKSYLGLAVAYAIHEGKIKSLDDYAVNYFEEFDKELLGRTTIRNLITHSHGLNEDEYGMVYREFDPGQGWAYRGINVLMMTQLIKQLYNQSVSELLHERIFLPLGYKETAWQTKENENLVKVIVNPNEEATSKLGNSNDGTESNLYVSAREFAHWGNLHLRKGNINGEQVVPKEVIEIATQVQSPTYKNAETPLNGAFWFVQGTPSLKSEIGDRVPKGAFQIIGVTGPTLLVIPEYNVVVAKMYNKRYNYEGIDGKNYLYYLREFSNLVADIFSE
ncbi:beta-lactamase family protein [Sporosarcina sp. resist]|nr:MULTISPECIES: serine hydrolase domain-containing protein [Sporosarcina]AMQ05305.1 penicillin-binding protein [Sporosarcina psychrophila]QNK89025.1 beta-lactamase family protein [Sporosarcina sp. resist]